VTSEELDGWFIREILPLEGALMRYLAANWRNAAEIVDLRQEVYVRVYDAAARTVPAHPRAFLFATARNLLIDSVRRARVVPIDSLADPEAVGVDMVDPERDVSAREEWRRFLQGLERLPARCREVVRLRKIDGLSQREVAQRLGISEDTVERQVRNGVRAVADFMLGGAGRIQRPASKSRAGRS
jgi:RNA polymerase sigma-70 factor (ECF subfamily)